MYTFSLDQSETANHGPMKKTHLNCIGGFVSWNNPSYPKIGGLGNRVEKLLHANKPAEGVTSDGVQNGCGRQMPTWKNVNITKLGMYALQ